MHDQPEDGPHASSTDQTLHPQGRRDGPKRILNLATKRSITFLPGDYLFELATKVVVYVGASYLAVPPRPLEQNILARSRVLLRLRNSLLVPKSASSRIDPALPQPQPCEAAPNASSAHRNAKRDWVRRVLFELYNNPALQQPLAYLVDYVPSKWLLEQEAPAIWQARGFHGTIQKGRDPATLQTPETIYDWARESELRGLCLSGGGIRSATFNLGILQGLAAQQALARFDYLSSVSGGGYIHGWLAAWLRRESGKMQQQGLPPKQAARQALEQVQAAMAPIPETRRDLPRLPKSRRLLRSQGRQPSLVRSLAKDEANLRRFPPPELLWLRQFSNYLTPQKGLLTLDTWTAVAIWLRNTFLNQLALISGLLFFLLLPWLLAAVWKAPGDTYETIQPPATPAPFRYTLTVKSRLDRDSIQGAMAVPPTMLNGQASLSFSTVAASSGGHSADKFEIDYLQALKREFHFKESESQATSNKGDPPKTPPPTCATKDMGITLSLEFLSFGLFLAGSFLLGRLLSQEFHFIRNLDEVIKKGNDARTSNDCQVPYIEEKAVQRNFGGPWEVRFIIATLLFPSIPFCYALCCPGPGLAETIFAGSGLLMLCLSVAVGGNAFCRPGLPGILRWLRQSAWKQFLAALGAAGFGTAAFLLVAACIHTAAVERWGAHLMRCSLPAVELALGVPLLASLPFFTLSILVGLVGHSFVDWLRELLGRVLAITLLATLGWLAFFAIALLSPGLFLDAVHSPSLKVSSILAWAATTAASVIASKSPKTSGSASAKSSVLKAELLATIGPYVYIIGLLVVLSSLVQLWVDVPDALRHLWIAVFVCAGFFVVLCWRLDATTFSLFPFYRNRLTRCYLGASNVGRNPSSLTGFDDRDTAGLQLKCLTPSQGYPGPFPIFCATLNLTTGTELAYQERKGASFAFTPCYSGYAVSWTEAKPGTQFNGYVPTETYATSDGGLNLATAIAVSGAAVSPNWGFHTKPATAFLLTMFNARLGRWLPNTRTQETAGRRHGTTSVAQDASPNGFALLNELLGRTDDSRKYIYLSDGGHFDNMGLYELVRRRCYHIVICDAEEDENYIFDGIGSTIRKCRIDFGVEIELDLSQLRKVATTRFSSAHVVTGTVRYPEAKPGQQGTVTYIKASLVTYKQVSGSKGVASDLPDLPADVQSYYLQHKDFPHDPTLEQWFTESQFESYRRLGQAVVEAIPSILAG